MKVNINIKHLFPSYIGTLEPHGALMSEMPVAGKTMVFFNYKLRHISSGSLVVVIAVCLLLLLFFFFSSLSTVPFHLQPSVGFYTAL